MSKLDSLIEDALLREDAALLQIADTTEEHTFSADFEKKLEAKIHTSAKRTHSMMRRAVALVAVAALLVCSVSAYAFWDQIIALLVKIFPQYAEYRMAASVVPSEAFHDFPAGWTEIWVPEYMTDGYVFYDAVEAFNLKRIIFAFDSSQIILEQCENTAITLGDSEGNMVPRITIAGQPVDAFQKQIGGSVQSRVAWANGNYYFALYGPVVLDELIRIGESLIVCEMGEK